jgi:hypothetical protein
MIKKQQYIHDFVTGFYLPVIKMNLTSRPLRVNWSVQQQYPNIDVEAELTALLSEQVATEIDREILRGVVTPTLNVEYNNIQHNLTYVPIDSFDHLVNWRTEDTWDLDGLYGSLIGVGMELKPLNFLPKKNISFLDSVTLPRVRRMFC